MELFKFLFQCDLNKNFKLCKYTYEVDFRNTLGILMTSESLPMDPEVAKQE